MSDTPKTYTLITDFISGKEIPNVGSEENRQRVAQFLVNEKGFSKEKVEREKLIFRSYDSMNVNVQRNV